MISKDWKSMENLISFLISVVILLRFVKLKVDLDKDEKNKKADDKKQSKEEEKKPEDNQDNSSPSDSE